MVRYGNYHHFKLLVLRLYFFFQVLSTEQQTRVSWTLSVRKVVPWCNLFLWKLENSRLYYLVSMTEDPIQRFESAWVSIWEQCRGFKNSWMNPMMIMKVQQLVSFTVILFIRTQLPNCLLRSRPWSTTIPVCQSGHVTGIRSS